MKNQDLSAILPDGTSFDFWEVEGEYPHALHVDCTHPAASDENDGSAKQPLRTINAAARIATPGTRVLIHPGIYRECVHPAMGGTDPAHMISYEAWGEGDAIIRASEQVTDFIPSTGWRLSRGPSPAPQPVPIWEHSLDPDMFRGYNPFCAVNILHDRLFIEYDKTDMTPYLNRRGCVFCDGVALRQVALYNQLSEQENTYWVEANGQKVHFRLRDGESPQDHCIELTVREQCFAPETPFLNYIRVKGLICEHAATGAPVPQRGAISCYRGHHWVIEDCQVNWSNAVAIDVGNECWHHELLPDQVIGHSVVRGCQIRDAGVCGIAGLFATHMLIEDNEITGTGWQHMELSWEAGAIKLHNSVNGLIRRNLFQRTYWADHLWLDCGNINNRITANRFLDGIKQREAIFIECTRDGVNLIDNNIIWNVEGRFDPAKVPVEPGSSGWYKLREHDVVNGYAIYGEGTDRLQIVHNLIGKCRHSGYYAKPVPFRLGFDRGGTSRKAQLLNNLFYDCGEAAIVLPTMDNEAEGNVYVKMTGGYLRVMYPEPEVCLHLSAWQEFCGFDLHGQNGWFDMETDGQTLRLKPSAALPFMPGDGVQRMGFRHSLSELPLVSPVPGVEVDYFGHPRQADAVLPGPFAVVQDEYNLVQEEML